MATKNTMTLKFDYRGLRKVISGGQVGVDQGGLAAAFKVGLLTGGTAPRGFKVSGGNNVLLECFGLVESYSPDYPPRTEENVKNSDATLIIATDLSSAGEVLTQNLARKHQKPCFVINIQGLLDDEDTFYQYLRKFADQAALWLVENQVNVLNVAGNRDPRDQTSMYDITKFILAEVFERLDADNLLIRDTDL
jgi:hypothetical protein